MSRKKRKLKSKRIQELKNNRIHTGKFWWKHLSNEDKSAFIGGFNRNKRAEDLQKQEIESNKRRKASK